MRERSEPIPLREHSDSRMEGSLAQRVQTGMWVLLLALAVYSAVDLLLGSAGKALYGLRLVIAGTVVTALVFVRRRHSRRATVVATTVASAVIVCACVAVGGILTADTATPALLSAVLVTVSATLLPWGVVPHSILVAVSALGTLAAVYGAHGRFPPAYAYPGGALLAVWIGSFYVLREVQRNRRAMAREMRERRRAEEQARQQQATLAHVGRLNMMGEMAAQLAHELNQPLGAIVSYARGCSRRIGNDPNASPEILAVLDQISEQAVRASEIIRRLREFVRKTDARREKVDLNALIRHAAELAAPEARDYGIHIRLDLAPSLPHREVDPIQIEQVVLNLLRNGVEATGSRDGTLPEVTITSEADGRDRIIVAVTDNGPGIPEDVREHIFDPFFTTKPRGLGMGLAISRSIIESHGGRLWAEPGANGGARLLFRIPAPGRRRRR